jgi:tRNA threonylcarbamoyladenosine biosynthesis protein TsaB
MNAVLALDCATIACSAAVWRDGEVVARRLRPGRRGHAEVLMPMVQDVMAEADLAYDALDAIAATVGPGTFTGLRIGLAAARGLALAAGLPLVGVTTLEAIAHGVPESARAGRTVLVVLDARRGQVYAQAFGPDLAPRGEPAALAPGVAAALVDDADKVLLAGDGVDLVRPRLVGDIAVAPGDGLPDAAVVAALAARRAAVPASRVAPLYLRAPDARPRETN